MNSTKKNNIRLRVVNEQGGEQVFKSIIDHPMETGYRRDQKTGANVPADYIENVQFIVDGKKYFEFALSEYVSRNPLLSFTFAKPLVDGQQLRISWVDNSKNRVSYDFVIIFDQNGAFSFSGEKKESEIYQNSPDIAPICTNAIRRTHD